MGEERGAGNVHCTHACPAMVRFMDLLACDWQLYLYSVLCAFYGRSCVKQNSSPTLHMVVNSWVVIGLSL